MSPSVLLQHYGYVGVAVALILEFLLIPFPAETILVFSGIMWHKGLLSLVPLLIAATTGSWTGSMIAYGIGNFVGRPVLLKYGKYVRLDEKKLHKAEVAFTKYSVSIVGLGRFIAGIRVLIAYVAGIDKMNLPLYMVLTAISAFLWSMAFIMLGSTISASWRLILNWILQNPILSGLAVLLLVVAGVVYWRKKKLRARATETAAVE